jgi:hypothetical protein
MSVAGIALTTLLTLSGCGQAPSRDTSAAPSATAESHEHPTEGPHHGSLIELGNEEYHAELLHDEQAGTITVYILDSAAKQAVPIDATELTVNLSHDGQAEQFSLAASPQSSDPPGQSSRFTSSDAELAEELDHEHAEAQLVVTINAKQFRGTVAHDHDHEEDDHHDQ